MRGGELKILWRLHRNKRWCKYEYMYHVQYCQLLAKLSGKSDGKIRLLRKKFGSLLNLNFWRHLGWWKFCYLCRGA
jgi:hypothetical protein